VSGLLIGYARVSTDEQDLTVQRDALAALDVTPERIHVGHGLTGTNHAGPGCARPWPRAGPATPWSSPSSTGSPARYLTPRDRRRAHGRGGQAQHRRLGARPHRPLRPAAVQRARHDRRIRGRPHPAPNKGGHEGGEGQGAAARQAAQAHPRQEAHLVELHQAGKHTSAELAELFNVARSTVYRALARARATT
jgi:DNA invertase Pin-like site-specific DNA recombinase